MNRIIAALTMLTAILLVSGCREITPAPTRTTATETIPDGAVVVPPPDQGGTLIVFVFEAVDVLTAAPERVLFDLSVSTTGINGEEGLYRDLERDEWIKGPQSVPGLVTPADWFSGYGPDILNVTATVTGRLPVGILFRCRVFVNGVESVALMTQIGAPNAAVIGPEAFTLKCGYPTAPDV